MKLRDITLKEERNQHFPRVANIPSIIPKIDLAQLKFLRLTMNGFYDGALAGILEYQNRQLYFQVCDGTSWYGYGDEIANFKEDFYRRYLILDLSSELLEQEAHWDNLLHEMLDLKMTKTQFYEKYDYKRVESEFDQNLLGCQVIAWFEIINPREEI